MLITEAPQRDLAFTTIKFGERGGVFLQDLQADPPVMPTEVIPEAVPGPRQSWAPRKGAGALGLTLWETNAKYLWDLLYLAGRQPVPVDTRFRPMHALSVRRWCVVINPAVSYAP